jgi:hypothetical protein
MIMLYSITNRQLNNLRESLDDIKYTLWKLEWESDGKNCGTCLNGLDASAEAIQILDTIQFRRNRRGIKRVH